MMEGAAKAELVLNYSANISNVTIDNDLMNMLSVLKSRFRRGQYFTNIGQFSLSKLKHCRSDPLLKGKNQLEKRI